MGCRCDRVRDAARVWTLVHGTRAGKASLPRTLALLCFGIALAWSVCQPVVACTTAVISGRVTADGRPLLWKNRDTRTTRRNEVDVYDGEQFRVMAVFDAGKRSSVWMGANSAGFCIENSLSRDLGSDEEAEGLGNGALMKLALETCATVDDFRALLDRTNTAGRKTTANLGVIDAHGGAALFEVGPASYSMFDANDPQVAPRGYIVRANFATTAHGVAPTPTAEALVETYSGERYARGCDLIEAEFEDGLTVDDVVRRLFRDLANEEGCPFPGTVNGPAGELPATIPKSDTISRTTTVSAAVFHGVRPGEDPLATTMWVALGDPTFSIAVPCWVGVEEPADAIAGADGGEICGIANTLREWSLTRDRSGVHTEHLPQLWQDVWPAEDALLREVAEARHRWETASPTAVEQSGLHQQLAVEALTLMRSELSDMKAAALALPSPPPPMFDAGSLVRVGIYDDAAKVSNGPRHLLAFLTPSNGFAAERITSARIRDGELADFDVLIMPGGSGSQQAARLEEAGREQIRSFVRAGGGYVGICAGAYLATTYYDWSLGLINARVWDRCHWARGGADVELGMSPAGCRLLDCEPSVRVRYNQGPLLVPDNQPDVPGYEVLATFETEVAEKGAPAGAMAGTHAIIRSMYGRGRVICFSPHPEVTGGPNTLVREGVRWAGGALGQ